MPESPVKIGYLILAHHNSWHIGRMVRILSGGDSRIVLHLDASVKGQQRADFLAEVRECGEVEEAKPVKCRWGDWSLVAATLSGLKKFRDGGDQISHIILLSGTHFPIRSPRELEAFLDNYPDTDFIEAQDAETKTWVRSGPNLERFQYFYPIDFQAHRRWYELVFALQKKIGVKRSLPEGLRPHLGSQWWCLRFSTCVRILDFLHSHPKVIRYFKSTWIPDESFFQTLVANLCKQEEVTNGPFVLHALTPQGRPYVFHNDHQTFLTGKRHHFFMRKISPWAEDLYRVLEDRVSGAVGREVLETTPTMLNVESNKFCSKIDSQFALQRPLPGHLHDNYTKLFKAIEQPVFVILGSSFSDDRIDGIAEALSEIPDVKFLGRPFRKDVVELTGVMEELGLSEKSFEIRDRFTCQLFYDYFTRRQCGIAVVVDPDLDFESWRAFCHLQNYFPIYIADPTKPDQPRYQQLAFLNRMNALSGGAKVPVMTDAEVVSYINFLCSKGALADSLPVEGVQLANNYTKKGQKDEELPLKDKMVAESEAESFTENSPIERNIFFLWSAGLEDAPYVVRRAYELWKKLNPGWTIHFFDEQRLNEALADWPKAIHKAAIQARANALRIEMLHQHGGVWVDATLIPTKPLEQWVDSAVQKSGFFAFRLAQPCERRLDNWFLAAAQPGHPIIDRWRASCMKFWGNAWLYCNRGSKKQQAYRKPPMGIIPEFDASQPVEYPYHWMHYLFNRLCQDDKLVKKIWKKTPFWLAKNSLLPSRLFFNGNYREACDSLLRNDAPVKKIGYNLNWPKEIIKDRADAILHKFVSESQSVVNSSSPGLGAPKLETDSKQKNCFVIFSYPRSGSYLLIDLLNKIEGVKCHGEIFKNEAIELDEDIRNLFSWDVKQRDQRPHAYLSKIIDLSEGKAIGFKLLASQSKTMEVHMNGSDEFSKIILRRNVIDVYISLQRAKATGVWVDKGIPRPFEDASFLFEAEQFEHECHWHHKYYHRLECCAKKRPHRFLLIDYEEVVDRSAFERICPFLGVPTPPAQTLMSEMKKQTTEKMGDLIINIEEMKNYIRDRHPKLFPILENKLVENE